MSSALRFAGGVGRRAAGYSVPICSKAVAGFSEPGSAGARKLPWEIFVAEGWLFCRGPGWDLIACPGLGCEKL